MTKWLREISFALVRIGKNTRAEIPHHTAAYDNGNDV